MIIINLEKSKKGIDLDNTIIDRFYPVTYIGVDNATDTQIVITDINNAADHPFVLASRDIEGYRTLVYHHPAEPHPLFITLDAKGNVLEINFESGWSEDLRFRANFDLAPVHFESVIGRILEVRNHKVNSRDVDILELTNRYKFPLETLNIR